MFTAQEAREKSKKLHDAVLKTQMEDVETEIRTAINIGTGYATLYFSPKKEIIDTLKQLGYKIDLKTDKGEEYFNIYW